jgi:hypothetical protein
MSHETFRDVKNLAPIQSGEYWPKRKLDMFWLRYIRSRICAEILCFKITI